MDAFISFMEFNGNVESISLDEGDDMYPEVIITPSYDLTPDDLIDKLNTISDKIWMLSDGEDNLLLVSVAIDG